jgi:hypothetical protein
LAGTGPKVGAQESGEEGTVEIRETVYFDRPGRLNTKALAEVVRKRCEELGVTHVVLASSSGKTALVFHEALQGLNVALVAVASHAGFRGGDAPSVDPAQRKELEAKGIAVLVCAHALSGVERSISNKFGGRSHVEIIAETLKLFGTEGVKVAVEVAVMAADAGLVPTDREVIAVGGTGGGADTALVLQAAHMNNFFDLEVREIVAKPRQRRR